MLTEAMQPRRRRTAVARAESSVTTFLVGALLTTAVTTEALAVDRFHFWIKGFIPNSHADLPGYFFPTRAGTWVLRAPALGGELEGTCFETDNRGYSDSPIASARVTVEFVMVVDGGDVGIEPAEGRDFRRVGETRNVDCITGEMLKQPKRADLRSVAVGPVKRSRGLSVVNARASTSDPFYLASPRLDFEAVLQFLLDERKLNVIITAGTFPSFEAYYRLNNGPAVPVVLWPATGTVYSLFDLGTGINSRRHDSQVALATSRSEGVPRSSRTSPPDAGARSPWAGAKRHIRTAGEDGLRKEPALDDVGVATRAAGHDADGGKAIDGSFASSDGSRDPQPNADGHTNEAQPDPELDVEVREAGQRTIRRIRELQDQQNALGPPVPTNEGDSEFVNQDDTDAAPQDAP